jgi:hypothetical protein
MAIVTLLMATWNDGLFVMTGDSRHHELAGQPVRGLASDGDGGVIAILGGHSLCRRRSDGEWITIAASQFELACAVAVGDVTYVGTDDARVLRVSAGGTIDELSGFQRVADRDSWYAGSALINGQRVGPPLGVRSITANSDGTVLLANVHVGGIPRSTDGGLTWQPTIPIDSDVHEVRAHPRHPGVVIAATAAGLYTSRDAGETWALERAGLHALYCAAVAFCGDDLLVSASADHFATRSAVYRRAIDGLGPLVAVGAGLPTWMDGIVDTGCISTLGASVAMTDRGGNIYLSADAGRSFTRTASGLPQASSILII